MGKDLIPRQEVLDYVEKIKTKAKNNQEKILSKNEELKKEIETLKNENKTLSEENTNLMQAGKKIKDNRTLVIEKYNLLKKKVKKIESKLDKQKRNTSHWKDKYERSLEKIEELKNQCDDCDKEEVVVRVDLSDDLGETFDIDIDIDELEFNDEEVRVH